MENFTLKEIENKVDKLIQRMGGYWPPLSMLASIIEEVGELAREINAFEEVKPKKTQDIDPQEDRKASIIQNIGEELSDLLFSLVCVANYFKIDLTHHFDKILKKYEIRDKNRFN
jgi:NTP pyrophosphatase (non-canonical NTP hydrolase)